MWARVNVMFTPSKVPVGVSLSAKLTGVGISDVRAIVPELSGNW